MLKTITGFKHTAEAQKIEAAIEHRQSGAALFATTLPSLRSVLQAPKI